MHARKRDEARGEKRKIEKSDERQSENAEVWSAGGRAAAAPPPLLRRRRCRRRQNG